MTKIEREARKAWLASLKAGDEVANIGSVSKPSRPFIQKLTWTNDEIVSWRSPACKGLGPTEVSRATGSKHSPYGNSYIVPATDEIREQVTDSERARRLSAIDPACRLTPDQRKRICAILDEGQP